MLLPFQDALTDTLDRTLVFSCPRSEALGLDEGVSDSGEVTAVLLELDQGRRFLEHERADVLIGIPELRVELAHRLDLQCFRLQ